MDAGFRAKSLGYSLTRDELDVVYQRFTALKRIAERPASMKRSPAW